MPQTKDMWGCAGKAGKEVEFGERGGRRVQVEGINLTG